MPFGDNDWLALNPEPTLEPELPICDPHHHFWDLRPQSTPYQRYHLRRGDWQQVVAFGIGAMICGWFWEMWNFWAIPKWYYTIPYVDFAHVFEMPVLGYLGYFPFGLGYVLVIDALVFRRKGTSLLCRSPLQ